MSAVVSARRLEVGYGGQVVLGGIDAHVAPGAAVALVGSNGSGKSTFLKTVAGLVPPLSGAIEVLGAAPGRRGRDVAYLGQHRATALALPLRVIDVVRTARFDHRSRFARRTADDDRSVADALERLEIADLADRSYSSLSGGQRQRVHLAQIVARRATLLLLDEPTASLDAPGRALYIDVLRAERARGAAVITATHDLGEATECDRIMLVARRVVADGPPSEVLTPDNLLETFGLGLSRIGDRLVVTEHLHGHDHDHSHERGDGGHSH